jgi:sirohydrochlorin cobaltochelatase
LTSRTDRVTVFFCHGSRSAAWREPFELLASDYRECFPGERVRLAFLELMSPGLPEVVADEAAAGTRSIRIVPLFLAPGAHTGRDLPALVAQAVHDWPQLEIAIEPSLLESPALRRAIVQTLSTSPIGRL